MNYTLVVGLFLLTVAAILLLKKKKSPDNAVSLYKERIAQKIDPKKEVYQTLRQGRKPPQRSAGFFCGCFHGITFNNRRRL